MSHACPLCVVGSAHHMISSVDVIVHHFNCLYDCKNVNSYELFYLMSKKNEIHLNLSKSILIPP